MSRDTLLAPGQTGIAPFPLPVVRLVAGCELLAAVALIVPRWSGVLAVLSPLAAVELSAVMIGAAGPHPAELTDVAGSAESLTWRFSCCWKRFSSPSEQCSCCATSSTTTTQRSRGFSARMKQPAASSPAERIAGSKAANPL